MQPQQDMGTFMSRREMFHSWSLPSSLPLSTTATLFPRSARVVARKMPSVPVVRAWTA